MNNNKLRMLTGAGLGRGQRIDPEYNLLKKVFDGVGMTLEPGILSNETAAQFDKKNFSIIGLCIYCTYKGKKYAIYKEADPRKKPDTKTAAGMANAEMIARIEKCIDNIELNEHQAGTGQEAPDHRELPQLDIFIDGNLRIKP